MRLRTVPLASWPPLAWLASCIPASDEVTVFVGPGVEVDNDWVCEGVWDAPFAEGDFDRTDLVFGSGVRVRDDSVVFVSSGTTLDRLHALDSGDQVYVSNSLPGLLSVANGSLDPACIRYRQIGRSIMHGLDEYKRDLPTTAGTIRLTYFDNLTWDGQTLVRRDRSRTCNGTSARSRRTEPSSTNRWNASRRTQRQRARTNRSSCSPRCRPATTRRPRPSSLVGVGCRQAFGFDRARGGHDDSGAAIAQHLGLRYHAVETSAWRAQRLAAVPFLAAITSGGSSVPYKGAESLLARKVVFTGYHGDKVWGTERPTDARARHRPERHVGDGPHANTGSGSAS